MPSHFTGAETEVKLPKNLWLLVHVQLARGPSYQCPDPAWGTLGSLSPHCTRATERRTFPSLPLCQPSSASPGS